MVVFSASFSIPNVKKKDSNESDESTYLCQTSGGYPQPVVYWLVDSQEPPNGSVWTEAEELPDSPLYNITSQLTVNVSRDVTVSCTVENPPMNETLTFKCESLAGAQSGHTMHRRLTHLCFRLAHRRREQKPRGDTGLRGHVDLQHGPVRGGRHHGLRRGVLSDPPGQDK